MDKGDLLFIIDPKPLEAVLERALGALLEAEARYELAKLELGRRKRLLETDSIAQERHDEQFSETLQAEAQVKIARAAVRSAELDLEFTRVRSPIQGRISRHLLTIGNLVTRGGDPNSTTLTSIVTLDPIYFYFDVDERTYLRYLELEKQGKGLLAGKEGAEVFIKTATDKIFIHRGTIDFVDPSLDQQTNTLRMRAVIPNPDLHLAPGMFGRIRIPRRENPGALLIPGKAVGTDQTIHYLYILKPDNTVERRRIVLGPPACGLRVVREGLQESGRVIIQGLQKVRPGQKASPIAEEITVASRDCLAQERKAVSAVEDTTRRTSQDGRE